MRFRSRLTKRPFQISWRPSRCRPAFRSEASMELSLKPWRRFRAEKDDAVIRRWLGDVAEKSEEAFRKGIDRTGRFPPASRPGQYPAIRSGALKGSISSTSDSDSATVGSGVFYAVFLRTGTRKMARRAMSDNALREGSEGARGSLRGWAKWTR